MAISLLTDAEKAEIISVFDDIHETFKRNITLFIKKSQAISSSPTNYNPLYGRTNNNQQSVEILEPVIISARIKYINNDNELFDDEGQLSLSVKNGQVRIKVSISDNELVKKAAKIEVDGLLYNDIQAESATTPFNTQYLVYILNRE